MRSTDTSKLFPQQNSTNELSSLCKKFLLAISGLFLLAMHVPFPSLGKIGLEHTSNLTTWIAFSLVIGIGCYQIALAKKIRYSKFTLMLLVSCTLLTLPLFYMSASWQASYQRIITLWAGITFFFLLQQFDFKDKRYTVLWFVLLAVLIEISLGYTQILFFIIGEQFGFITTHLPLGIFQQVDLMASFLATGLAIASFLLPVQTKTSARLFLLSIPSLTLPLLFVLPSTMGWIASIISLLFLLPYCLQCLKKKLFLSWFFSIVIGAVCANLLLMIPSINSKISNPDLHILELKAQKNKQLIDMILTKPWAGFGYGQLENQYIKFTAKHHFQNPTYPAGFSSTEVPQNEVLLWVVEGGSLPLIAISLATGAVLFQIYKARKTKKLAILALFIPITLHSMLDTPFSYSFVHWLIFIILLWWIDIYSRTHSHRLKIPISAGIKVASLAVPTTLSIFMLLMLQANYWLAKYEKSAQEDLGLLSRIMLPFPVQNRIDAYTYTAYLKKGIKNEEPSLIMLYVNWAQSMLKTQIKLDQYLWLILAYRALNDQQNVRLIKNEAKFLFPREII